MKKLMPLTLCLTLILSLFSDIAGTKNSAKALSEIDPPITSHTLIGKQAPNGIYYGTVTVQLSAVDYGSGVARTQYSLDNGATWRNYAQPVSFTDKKVHQVQYRSVDNNNNVEPVKSVEFTIKQDIWSPESTINLTGTQGNNTYYVSPVSFSIHAEDFHSEISKREYSLDGGNTWMTYTNPVQVTDEQNTVVHYRSIDTNGNVEKAQRTKINIDLTPPSKPDIISSPMEWSNSQFVVSIVDGVDGQSGTASSQYRIGEAGTWAEYSSPFPVSGSGQIKVYARTIDFAGNASELAEHVLKFDVTPPTTPEIELSQADWSNSDVYVTLYPGTDTESQVQGVHYRTGTNTEWMEYVDAFGISEEGITPIYARTVDWAGNISGESEATVKIDLTAPAAPTFVPDSEDWTNQNVHLQIIPGQDALSGAIESRYRIDDSEDWLIYEAPLLFTEEGISVVHAFTYDRADNASDESSHTVRIDKTPPTAPGLTPSTTDWTNQDVLVVLESGTDALSGVNRNEYRIGETGTWIPYTEPFTMSDEGDFKLFARTVDHAGNFSSITESTVKIDKTALSAPASVFKINQVGATALFRWTPSTDNLSGVAHYEIYNGNELLATSTENMYRLTNLQTNKKYAITVKAVDRANNRSLSSNSVVFYTNEPSITAGRDRSFAWNQQGTVWGWGNNNYGQLGDGTRTPKHSATQIPALHGFTKIVTGVPDNIGLRPDGTVWRWGDERGQLLPPTKVNGLENVVSISMGIQHYMALKEDGTVWAWGDNFSGMLGDGTTEYRSTPVQVVGLNAIVAISSGYYHSMALREDGTVWVWGNNGRGQLGINAGPGHEQLVPVQVPGLSNVIQIDTEYMHNAVLVNDGTVWTWGYNEYGQLGNGLVIDSFSPVKVNDLSGVIKLSASYGHNLALTEDGSVWSWGGNAFGEIGDGTTIRRNVPVKVAHLEGITDIFAGEFYSLAVKSNGSVWAWGMNNFGQLGDGTTTNRITRTLVSGIPYPTDTDAPSVPENLRAAGKTSSTVILSWDASTDNHAVKEYLVYQGSTLIGTVGVDGKTIDSGTEFTQVGLTSGSTYSFTVRSRDYAGNTSASSNVVTVTTERALPVDVTSHLNHTIAVKSDGSVWGWGYNNRGQLGELAGIESLVPVQSVNLTSVVAVSSGNSFNLALRSDGTVWAWGTNENGQLGTSAVTMSHRPLKVEGLDSVVAVSAGSTFSLALKSDGTVWAWGSNYMGELGLGTTGVSVYTPRQVLNLSGITSITSGLFFSLAIKSDGTVWAWGINTNGQLGNGTTTSASIPFRITSLSNVVGVSAGMYHSMAVKQDGTVWTWGSNNFGELGDGTRTERRIPVQVSTLSGIKKVSAGMYYSMAMSDSTIYSWGDNNYGQLGNGTTMGSNLPVALTSLTSVKQLNAGYLTSSALANDTIMMWGNNSNGQLGNGNKNNSRVPVPVNGMGSTASTSQNINRSQVERPSSEIDYSQFEIDPEILKLGLEYYDLFAPTVPQEVSVEESQGKLLISWSESKDNIGVKEYWVYLNGIKIARTEQLTAQIEIPREQIINITVKAVDKHGNESDPSIPVAY